MSKVRPLTVGEMKALRKAAEVADYEGEYFAGAYSYVPRGGAVLACRRLEALGLLEGEHVAVYNPREGTEEPAGYGYQPTAAGRELLAGSPPATGKGKAEEALMLSMRIERVVAAIVEQELRGRGRGGEALYFAFDLRMGHYDDGEEYAARRALHLLYQCNPGGTYISVFWAQSPSPMDRPETLNWRHGATHDSCWRDINVFSQTYFDMAKSINEALERAGKKTVAPKDMNEYHTLPLSGGLFKWVKARVEHDPTDTYGHRRLVKFDF